MMSKPLVVKNEIVIYAPASKVWEVLINPRFIKQWDELPDGYGEENLKLGSVIEWVGNAVLTVSAFEPCKLLRLSFYQPGWELPPESYSIAYTCSLSAQNDGSTLFTMEIGDFAQLPDGQPYYEGSIPFGQIASQRIKELAEQ
ncbi:hypothetical protein D3C78_623250 [compost metagenome]